MADKPTCFEIQSMPSGGFIVSDMSMLVANRMGMSAHQVFACSRIDEALDFIRLTMTAEAKVTLTEAEIEQLRDNHKPGEVTWVDDVPLWRR